MPNPQTVKDVLIAARKLVDRMLSAQTLAMNAYHRYERAGTGTQTGRKAYERYEFYSGHADRFALQLRELLDKAIGSA